ncbi:MAG: HD domain-containing protein [Clostridia bacterium]|nr:HD domain-containing protein [Clostridia bacterium]
MTKKAIKTNIFDKAVVFAVKAHKNTERKGHKTPYVLHVLEAASICATMTDDLELLSAVVLHDVLEDTNTSFNTLRKKFGDRIAQLVYDETEICINGKSHAETWKNRKKSIISKIKNGTIETKMVAIGDKLSNMRAIARDYVIKGDKLWKIFNNDNPKDIKWYYTSLVDVLMDLKEYPVYKEFSKLVNDVFKNIQ